MLKMLQCQLVAVAKTNINVMDEVGANVAMSAATLLVKKSEMEVSESRRSLLPRQARARIPLDRMTRRVVMVPKRAFANELAMKIYYRAIGSASIESRSNSNRAVPRSVATMKRMKRVIISVACNGEIVSRRVPYKFLSAHHPINKQIHIGHASHYFSKCGNRLNSMSPSSS